MIYRAATYTRPCVTNLIHEGWGAPKTVSDLSCNCSVVQLAANVITNAKAVHSGECVAIPHSRRHEAVCVRVFIGGESSRHRRTATQATRDIERAGGRIISGSRYSQICNNPGIN